MQRSKQEFNLLMHFLDILVFTLYMMAVIGIGVWFLLKNKGVDDYYVGGRKIGSWHIGLSVVATDVGGGFSIGLGGLGFIMGIAGSWMLFTGLIGAWLSAVLLIPRVKAIEKFKKFYTFPQMLGHFYNPKVALLAGIISGIGYLGFTSSQILAGAILAEATFTPLLPRLTALIIMGIIVIVYTAMGGIKAVIYTDTIQWIILMSGLIFIGIPIAYYSVGGLAGIREVLPPEYFSLGNISWQQIVNWAVTIIPIWFVGMTLYQRIYASRDKKQAQKAWYIAGIFEWPIMAFMGVLLGLFARVAIEQGLFEYLGFTSASDIDAEQGLPMLLRTVLPVGLMGLMMAAYFSAIMSTADSCLMASSGNFLTDIFGKWFKMPDGKRNFLLLSQGFTLVLGTLALLLATVMPNVLELMLYSYAFMVSGLFVPVMAALFLKNASSVAAFWAMLLGGSTTITLIIMDLDLPLGLDANIFGITTSLVSFVIINFLHNNVLKESQNINF
ncbi:MAG: sodium:solute symporter family protein [Bacteroidales bacterium]|nr:sodium:solute symporter family protein [Bacteroidales bacterium]